jgi:hypothetical protein
MAALSCTRMPPDFHKSLQLRIAGVMMLSISAFAAASTSGRFVITSSCNGLCVSPERYRDKSPRAARGRQSDFSAETITAALGSHFPVALVAEILAELKASGHYDRILAEAAAA